MNYFTCGKVYIHCSHEFFNVFDENTNFDNLLTTFAQVVQTNDNILISNGELRKRKIRNIILKEANEFITSLGCVPATENVYSHISHKQFKELEKTFNNRQGRISCYSLIIFHSMFEIMKRARYDFDDHRSVNIKKYMTFILNVVNEYYEDYPDDIIAHFLIECYQPIIYLWEHSNQRNQIVFPAIPKKYFGLNDEE